MRFKKKLAYMASGGLLVFLGQLLPDILSGGATAKPQSQSVKFDKIRCRSLVIVDDAGELNLELSCDEYGDYVTALGKNHKSSSTLGINGFGGFVEAWDKPFSSNSRLGIDRYGGFVTATGRPLSDQMNSTDLGWSTLANDEHGGVMSVYGRDGKSQSWLGITTDGAVVVTKDKEGMWSQILE